MRIVMLTNAVAPDKLGGLERYVREQASALRALGHEVAVVAKQVRPEVPRREVDPSGVITARYRVPSKRNPLFVLLYPIRVGLDIVGILRGAEAGRAGDVVLNVHHPVPAIVPMLLGLPYVYTFHAPVWREILPERHDSYFLPAGLGRFGISLFRGLEGLLLRRAALVVTLSRFVRDEAFALGVAPERHRLVPGGLDTDGFAPPTEERPRRDAVLFTARRLVDRTGVEQLVEAMPAVLRRVPSTRLRIAGAGARRDRIERRIEGLGLTHAVTLLGRIPDDALIDEYRTATLAVTPTQELEGFGLATAEALSVGAAALVTPVGANAEVVEGLSPLLVAADRTPRAIADAVVTLLEAPAELDRIRSAARAHVHPRFGWPAVAEQYVRLYEEVLSAR